VRVLRGPGEVSRLLAAGGVVLMPTDTLPGLHCRADRPESVRRLAALKGQPADKPLLVLCPGAEVALALAGNVSEDTKRYMARCWPGPFTLVLRAAEGLPEGMAAPGGTVAIRVPAPASLRRLLAAAGGPVASTSANRTGRPPCVDLATAEREFADGVDGVLRRLPGGEAAGGRASALLDLTVWPPRLLRAGPLAPPSWQ
jgi:L-threonylcarbamoyladenylate synthase